MEANLTTGYWVRTRYENGRWLWRSATAEEVSRAKRLGIPVQQLGYLEAA